MPSKEDIDLFRSLGFKVVEIDENTDLDKELGSVLAFPKEKEQEKFYTLVVGTPLTGFSFYGPFGEHLNAMLFAEKYLPTLEYWVAELKDTSSLVDKDSKV